MDRHNKIKVRKCITIIIRDWIIPLVPVLTVIIVMFYWGFYCWSRPSLKFNECNDAMLQQLTSYYETMITVLVMIITILLATSFASIYYVTRNQIRSVIEDVVEKEFQKEWFTTKIHNIIIGKLRSAEMIEYYDNNTNFKTRVDSLEKNFESTSSRIEGVIQDIQSEIDIIKRSYY